MAVSLADSVDLRVILSVLYIITEVMRTEKEAGSEEYAQLVVNFTNEISEYRVLMFEGRSHNYQCSVWIYPTSERVKKTI